MSQPADPTETGVTFALGPWQEVAPNVFRAVAEPEAVNLGLVIGSESALLVDTGSSPTQGAAVRASVGAFTDRPLTAVAVTHWHYDHAFGLAAFADLLTIGHESVRERLASAQARVEASRLGVDAADLVAPDRELAVATAVDLGDRRVEIAHLGAGHTEGDLVVVVPDAGVVFAGDLIESAGPPSFGDDAVPGAWAATLDGVIGLMTAATIVVPGHGDPVGREFVFEQRGRIAARAAAGLQQNRPSLPLIG